MRSAIKFTVIGLFVLLACAIGGRFFFTLYPPRRLVVEYAWTNAQHLESLVVALQRVRANLRADRRFVGADSIPEQPKGVGRAQRAADSWPVRGASGFEFNGIGVFGTSGNVGTYYFYVGGFRSDQKYSKAIRDMRAIMNDAIGPADMALVTVTLRNAPIFPGAGDP